jgi:Flp pilus assembly protein TadD
MQTGGNTDVALALAQTAHNEMPDSPVIADTLGWIYYQKGAYQSAVTILQQALKRQQKNSFPDNANIHYHLGMAYAKSGDDVPARQQLERMLKMNPTSSDATDARKQLAELRS